MFISSRKPIASIANNWQILLDEPSHGNSDWRRNRWNLLRNGRPLSSDLPALGWHWRIDNDYSTEGDGAGSSRVTKLLLRSVHCQDACECVVMLPRPTRATVCVSTQIGCGVGCTFCATGKMGWQRNLCTTEILEQVLLARQRVGDWSSSQKRNIHLRNVVFMGMGEPLHNDLELYRSLEWLISDKGFGFSPRHLTVSTAGVPGKMIELAKRFPRVRMALSLHAAEPELRRRLVPRATHDLESLRSAIREINGIDPLGPVWLEIALIAGINDSIEHAHAIHRFCDGLRVEINVIPYNDTSHASGLTVEETAVFQAPARETVRAFVEELRGLGWYTTWRNTFGDSIRAACGQLATGLTTQSPVS